MIIKIKKIVINLTIPLSFLSCISAKFCLFSSGKKRLSDIKAHANKKQGMLIEGIIVIEV
jgi:hypothetical protein